MIIIIKRVKLINVKVIFNIKVKVNIIIFNVIICFKILITYSLKIALKTIFNNKFKFIKFINNILLLLLILTLIYNYNEELLYIRLRKPLMNKNLRCSFFASILCSPLLSHSIFLYHLLY